MDWLTHKIFTKPFLITLLRYGLNAIGVWLAANQGFDPGTWETIAGAVLVIATSLFGATESVKDKAVVDGKTVDVAKLPPSIRTELKDAVEVKKPRSWFDVLVGK